MLNRAGDVLATRFRNFGAGVLVAGVLVLGGLTGCAAPGVELGEGARASEGLMDSAELIRESRRQVMAMSEALEALRESADGPLPAQRAALTEKMDDLELAAHRIAATSDRMRRDGAAYFEAWDAEIARINNEDVRYRPERRRRELAGTFDTLVARYRRLARAYSVYIADLRGVDSALEEDAALSGPITRAIRQGEDVVEATAGVADAYEALGVRMDAAADAGG